jgi:hypothetical protein
MEKPRLSFWQIWNMSFGFLGIQFGWGLQMANMSAIYQYLGARENEIPILWLAAPLTGLIVQPIIGYFSDRTWNRLGRRRPYFLGGAIAASLALLAMPNSSSLWMAAGLLWVLDASVNVSMEPFRAFVGDMLPHDQRKSGFAMQSLLIGAGAVLSSALPYVLTRGFGISGESTVTSAIPPTVHVAFTIGAFVFFLGVLYTVLTTPEYPPEDVAAFERTKRETSGLSHAFREIFQGIGSMPGPMRKLAAVQFCAWFALFCLWIYFAPGVAKGIFKGAPLGASSAVVDQTLDDPQNAALLDAGARAARSYEALKERAAAARPAGESRGGALDGVMTMLGLKASPPDPAAGITAADLVPALEGSLVAGGAVASEADRTNPMVRTIASLLGQGGLVPGAAADPTRPRRAPGLGPPVPGGRRVGRRVLRRLQPRGVRLLVPAPGAGEALQRPLHPHRLPRPRRTGPALGARRPGAVHAPRLHGGHRRRVGQHPRHAVRHALERLARREDGLLHGRLQLLHRAAPDPRLGRPGLGHGALSRQRRHEGAAPGRGVDAPRGAAHPAREEGGDGVVKPRPRTA